MNAGACTVCGSVRLESGACPTCLLTRASEPFAGLIIEDELGAGGMGSVFRATHVKLGRPVAVKFLSPELAASPEGRARFEREARALALLDHPSIVRIHDFGVEDGESYLVMELIEGGDLSKHVPMTAPEALRVASEVCDALHYAHAQGVVHRDIKPQNVMLDAQRRAKLTDFGIARVTRTDGQVWPVTSAQLAVGSAGFMAPEILAGAPANPAMDVYSVGALLRAMLTGRAPVGEASGLPAPIERVIRKAMAEQPKDRFASALELKEALDRVWAQPELPDDEKMWLRAVAFVQTMGIASVLWAGLLSLTPRVLLKNDLLPLTVSRATDIDDQHVLTRARFETGAVLLALGAVALAVAATALLKRHWRIEGLDRPDPEPPLEHSKALVGLSVVTMVAYAVRLATVTRPEDATHWAAFMPFFGGLLEVVVLYATVLSVLEATRRHRPLRREPWVWVGQGIALVPPICEFFRTL